MPGRAVPADRAALRRAAVMSVGGAVTGVVLLVLIWFAAFHIGPMHRADASILRGFADLQHPRVDRLASFIARLCDPKPFVYFAVVPVLVALLRRRPRLALAITAILFGANLTTQLLKPVLAEPRLSPLLGHNIGVASASWPSGHATAAMSLALCAVLAVPSRLRPATATLGAVFAIAVSYSFLTLGWHYPSDVLGGFLIALVWILLGVAALFGAAARWPPRRLGLPGHRLSVREALGPPVAVLVAGLGFVALVALARPHAVVAYARVHTTFIVGAAAIGTLALALATGVVLLSSPRGREAIGSGLAPRAAPRRGSHHG